MPCHRWQVVIVALSLALLSAPARAGSTIELFPVSDGEAFRTNGGAWGNLDNGDFELTLFGIDTGMATQSGSMAQEFDVTGIPMGFVVSSAQLFIERGGGGSGPGADDIHIFIHGYSGNGVVEETDFNVSNPIAGPFSQIFTPGSGYARTDIDADVTAYVQSLVDAGATHAGFVGHVGMPFLSTGSAAVNYKAIESFPNGCVFLGCPKLTVTFPEPDATLTALLAMLAVVLVRRRDSTLPARGVQ